MWYKGISSRNALASVLDTLGPLHRPQLNSVRRASISSCRRSVKSRQISTQTSTQTSTRSSTNGKPLSSREPHKSSIMSSGDFRYQYPRGPSNPAAPDPAAPDFLTLQQGQRNIPRMASSPYAFPYASPYTALSTGPSPPVHQNTPLSTLPPASRAPANAVPNTLQRQASSRPFSTSAARYYLDHTDPEKRPPSLESGGIPEPTPEYLSNASLPPFVLPYTRRILVVIDLNGTLLFRPSRLDPTTFIERPHARTFLAYCIEAFTVVIWSSAKPRNVYKMASQLLTKPQQSRVVAIWGRDSFGLTFEDYNSRTQCYKRLSKLWDDPRVAASHPDAARGTRWSQKDTVLVDDSAEKARSEPYNLVEVPEFIGDPNEPVMLPQVHDYLNELSRQVDISTYIRTSPFKPIDDWKLRPAPTETTEPAW
ncbi:HAD-like domain-containing protein [Whalleya microplaca]|nr:HAD-like domain-containing protein [Whalleya microplaca]